jgi:phosphoribosylformylglycinamidine synthase
LLCGAEVQKGNAPTERKLQRLFRNPEASGLIKKCNDFGAGGVAVAVGELADGIDIDLDKVLKKYEGLDGTELAISESQERMAVMTAAGDAEAFIRLAREENLEAVILAEVKAERRLSMRWRGAPVVNISRDFLDKNGAERRVSAVVKSPPIINACDRTRGDIKTEWLDNLSKLNVCCQKGLTERFDSVIGAGTVLMPHGGRRQLTPVQAMAAKLPAISGDIDTCTLMGYGFSPELSERSPFHGAAAAVVESVAKVLAAGGRLEAVKLSFQEYFGKPGEDPERFGTVFSALLGAFQAQMSLNVPSIGGKDSMSGTFTTPDGKQMDVPPTLVSFAVSAALLENVVSPELKGGNHIIGVLKCGVDADGLPDFEAFKHNALIVSKGIEERRILSAWAVGPGGISAGLSKMAFGNGVGVELETDIDLFYEDFGGFVLELAGELDGVTVIGRTRDKEAISANGAEISLEEALESWTKPLGSVFPMPGGHSGSAPEVMYNKGTNSSYNCSFAIKSPRVLIPVFPGTNSEYDTRARFDRAGAETELFVIRNLTLKELRETVAALSERIDSADIIALPGGFSAGDEPDGSGKYIASLFRSARIKESVSGLLNKRGGLMLGICNGFQALIKLGLLPYGEIREQNSDSPTLTRNIIGRHASFIARTKVTSNLSPWFALAKPGEVYNMPISHGEGRFTALEDEIKGLVMRGQIAAQYVDLDDKPTMDARYNPNGSAWAVEALTSPDGRVLGKMGHSERISDGIYKNVPGSYDQRIFEAAVRYFKHN